MKRAMRLAARRPTCSQLAKLRLFIGCLSCLLIASSTTSSPSSLERPPVVRVAAQQQSHHQRRHQQQQHHHHQHHHHPLRPRHRRHEQQQLIGGLRPSGEELKRADGGHWTASTFDMIAPAKTASADLAALGASDVGSGGGQRAGRHVGRRRHRRSRGERLTLAVNRLRILESLDAQLAAFASDLAEREQRAASASRGPESGARRRCELPLEFGPNKSNDDHFETTRKYDGADTESPDEEQANEKQKSPSCLSSDHLRRQIPAYMLNLHTKLQTEARSLQDALRLMPYKCSRMRSFRQAPPIRHDRLGGSSREPLRASAAEAKGESPFMFSYSLRASIFG